MGIKGLLPFLQSIQEPCHISSFSGMVVGVDAYCWLHRAAIGCALELVQGKETTFYISYFMRRLKILLDNAITPILVFDGAAYPAKRETENERHIRREENAKRGHELYAHGDIKGAIQFYQKSIDITPSMAAKIINECKKIGVSCLVAPYEADAQLAFLCHKNLINACISEDSDLLAFGCSRVIYKLENDGSGILIDSSRLKSVMSIQAATNRGVNFLELCILAGCDYLNSIKGMGIATACKLVQNYTTVKMAIKSLRAKKGPHIVKLSYEQDFELALVCFKHHCVFDYQTGRLTTLSGEGFDKLEPIINNSFSLMSDVVGFQVALGNLDPCNFNRLAFNNFNDFKVNLSCYKILYENSDKVVLKELFDEYKVQDKENTPVNYKISKSFIPPRHSLLSSSMPIIKERKSEYFTSSFDENDDQNILSSTIANKRVSLAPEEDEDIEMPKKEPCSQPVSIPQGSFEITSDKKICPRVIKLGLCKKNFTKKSTFLNGKPQRKLDYYCSKPN